MQNRTTKRWIAALGLLALAMCAPRHRALGQAYAPQLRTDAYSTNFQGNYIQRTIFPNVMFLGDSITDRWGEYPFYPGNPVYDKTADGNSNYNQVVTQSYANSWRLKVSHFAAYNFGISQDVVANVLARVQPSNGQQGDFDGPRTARVVVLMIGINDLIADSIAAAPDQGPQIAATIQAIRAYIQNKSPGTRMLILKVLPAAPSGVNAADLKSRIASLNQQIDALPGIQPFGSRSAKGYGSGDYSLDMGNYFAPGGTMNQSLYYGDGLHPSVLGYQVFGAAVAVPIRQMLRRVAVPNDFDGDGRTDLAYFERTKANWSIFMSGATQLTGNATVATYQYGNSSMIPAPADYDGDGMTDLCVFDPSAAKWYINLSNGPAAPVQPGQNTSYNAPQTPVVWGDASSIPVPADYDGDGKADIAVYAQSNGTWYVINSGGGSTTQVMASGSLIPLPADYDGDGKADIAAFDQAAARYYIYRSTAGYVSFSWGNNTIYPCALDSDGDGTDDVAGFDVANTYYYDWRASGTISFPFGTTTSTPVTGDYDGDGLDDWGVYDTADGNWILRMAANNQAGGGTFGGGGSHYIPLGATPFCRAAIARQGL